MKAFLAAAGERAARAAAAALLSVWLIGGVAFNLVGVDWGSSLGIAGGAAVISVLTSVAAGRFGASNDPSFLK